MVQTVRQQTYTYRELPKTHSGKVLRRSIRGLAEGESPGDLTTLEDTAGIQQIEDAVNEVSRDRSLTARLGKAANLLSRDRQGAVWTISEQVRISYGKRH